MDAITQGQTLQTNVPQIYRASRSAERKTPDLDVRSSGHPLDEPKYQERLKKLMQWRRQARVAQADNRTEMAIDEDYYDGIQLEPEELHILTQRSQPPLVFNIIKNTINWILGTERKSRIDFRVLPRKKRGAQSAKTKTKLLKYVQDVSKGEFERSEAFAEAVKAGLGWIETGARSNDDEILFMRQERWRNMWFDHLGLSLDGSDWRYIFREKWTDLDIAQGMFPKRMDRLKVIAEGVNSLYPYLPDDTVITDNASEFDIESDLDSLFGGPFDGTRPRVKMVECWYRMPAKVKIMHAEDDETPYGALDGTIFRADQEDHQYLVQGKYFSTSDAIMMTVRCAIWSGATLMQDILSPYNHNRFPFIPIFCYRRKRDNMPYGVIRDLRDPQSDLNRRRSRALVLLTANRVIMEKGAVDDKKKAYEELNRPDGMVEVNVGKRFEVQKELQLAQAHVAMVQDDERFIESISGVTPENKGTLKKDLSGKAIENIQIQGQTTSGVFFDNYFFAFQNIGEVLVSLVEQFKDKQAEIRITGDQQKDEFVTINERGQDGKILNNITETKADFVVSKQDYRETLRLAMFQMLSDLVQSLAKSMPQVALALLDEVVDFMDDLPNKDEIVARIRKINKQHGADDEMTPEEKQKVQQVEQQQQQKQQQVEALQMAMAQVELALKQAEATSKQSKAMKDEIEGQMKKLEGFLKALEVAATVSAAPQLVQAADQVIAEAQAAPGQRGGQPAASQAAGPPGPQSGPSSQQGGISAPAQQQGGIPNG